MAQVADGAETAASTERLVLFSDAVIAIAITLLVLDIKLPDLPQPISNAALTTALISIEPKLTAYVVSFLVVGLFWYGHLLRFRFIRRSDGRLICLNLLFLMTIGFVPLASAVLSEAKNAAAYDLYDGTMMLVALLATAILVLGLYGSSVSPSFLTAIALGVCAGAGLGIVRAKVSLDHLPALRACSAASRRACCDVRTLTSWTGGACPHQR